MKIIQQLAILFGISLLCEGIAAVLPFTFPASVIALLLVLVLLATKRLKVAHIEESSHFFLNNLPLLFVPASAGIINYWDILSAYFVPFVFICLFTMVLTYFVTAWVVNFTIKCTQGGKKK